MQDFDIHLTAVRVAGDGQIVALRGSHRKYIRVVRQHDVDGARDDQALGAFQILRMHPLIVDSREVDRRISESKLLGLMPQKLDSDAAALLGDIVLRARINLMIAETPEHAGFGAKPGQLAETGIQRIAGARDQIAGHQRDVRARFVRHVDGDGEFAFTQKRTQVDIGDLHDPQSVQILGKIWDGDRYFGNAGIGCGRTIPKAVAASGAMQRAGSRGLQQFSPRGIELRGSAPDQERQGQPDQPHGLDQRGAFQPSPPLDGEVLQNPLEFQQVASHAGVPWKPPRPARSNGAGGKSPAASGSPETEGRDRG